MGWGPGEGPEGVQLYIRFEKASPPRNGVRLHLTFLRLASLVGIGHEIATPWPLPRVSKPFRNENLSEVEINTLYSWLRIKKTTATKRTPFFPPPGVIHGHKVVKEKIGSRITKIEQYESEEKRRAKMNCERKRKNTAKNPRGALPP